MRPYQGCIESAFEAFEEIDERVDSEPENMETQENFNLIEELLNQKIKVVNKIRNYKMNKNKWIDNKSNKLQRH